MAFFPERFPQGHLYLGVLAPDPGHDVGPGFLAYLFWHIMGNYQPCAPFAQLKFFCWQQHSRKAIFHERNPFGVCF